MRLSPSLQHRRSRKSRLAAFRDGDFARSLAHAAKLPSVGEMVERVGESLRKIDETFARFQTLADN